MRVGDRYISFNCYAAGLRQTVRALKVNFTSVYKYLHVVPWMTQCDLSTMTVYHVQWQDNAAASTDQPTMRTLTAFQPHVPIPPHATCSNHAQDFIACFVWFNHSQGVYNVLSGNDVHHPLQVSIEHGNKDHGKYKPQHSHVVDVEARWLFANGELNFKRMTKSYVEP